MSLTKDQLICLDHYSEGCDCNGSTMSYQCGYCRDVKRRLHSSTVEELNKTGMMNGYAISPKGWHELQKRKKK